MTKLISLWITAIYFGVDILSRHSVEYLTLVI